MQTQVHDVGKLSQLHLKVNFANSMTAALGQAWGPRTIPDNQLIYVRSGKAKLILGSNTYQLEAEDCVFYGPNCPHQLIADEREPFTFASIHFEWNDVSPVPVHPMNAIKPCTKQELSGNIPDFQLYMDGYGKVCMPSRFTLHVEELFMKIVREYRFEEQGYMVVLKGLLTQLLTIILRHQIQGKYTSADRRKIAPALEMIRKQPQKNWTMDELASLCGYHPTYFASIFKKATGHTPKHYLILERISKAKRLLIETETVDEVAYQLGYTSVHYFCRNFKFVTGLTPTEYKLQSIEL
ncbi:AraC family transcriptional regulator [Gracilibacillus alcaliphilus]|uniref:AraC family transcriptional regulator n=1 Tax=Gracilibacillus alcaliphilus TaxID=1401441 RepID=UPI00195717D3|nr:AraC family transcriptional regulator [Gracilibacillus alcaliphilus]MBM7677863.1 AraC-like DNA-binding protein/quercetin dioxygenase-like cupin family protein [Gracilibacillus alcaliphilus]